MFTCQAFPGPQNALLWCGAFSFLCHDWGWQHWLPLSGVLFQGKWNYVHHCIIMCNNPHPKIGNSNTYILPHCPDFLFYTWVSIIYVSFIPLFLHRFMFLLWPFQHIANSRAANDFSLFLQQRQDIYLSLWSSIFCTCFTLLHRSN